MRHYTEDEVRRLLPMKGAVAAMRECFAALKAGEAQNVPRRRLMMPTGTSLHMLAGSWRDYFGTKFYSAHPKHGANFFFYLFRAADGAPLASFDANWLGAIRTGAASGVATDLMAPGEAKTLGVIGSGFQAYSQIEAVLAVRAIEQVRVWSRKAERAAAFAAACSADFGVPVVAVATAEAAVRDSDILITATYAKEPVLASEWVKAGAHVNAMGSNQPAKREIPAELVFRSSLIAVDSVEQARMEAGDLLLAFDEEDWRNPRLVELQDLSAATVRYEGDVTLFKSVGLGVEDVAAAAYIFERS